jgi:HSPB1-associated protein 1
MEIRRLVSPSAEDAARAIATSSVPIVFEGMLSGWPAAQWTPSFLATTFSGLRTAVRLQRRSDSCCALEGACHYESATFAEFYEWQRGSGGERSAKRARVTSGLAARPVATHWGYADYKRYGELFPTSEGGAAPSFQWTRFGLAGVEATEDAHTTVWWGTEGARSHLHYDSYGSNLHAQLSGAKEWLLFSPSTQHAALLRPRRTPYEESSVFSAIDARAAGALDALRRAGARPLHVVLRAGEVLFVPRHWWHDVRIVAGATRPDGGSAGGAVSANVWLPDARDELERVHEGVVRLLVCAIMRGVGGGDGGGGGGGSSSGGGGGSSDGAGDGSAESGDAALPWLSPTEQSFGGAEDAALLHAQLSRLFPAAWGGRTPTELRAAIAQRLTSGDCLRAVVSALLPPP